MRLFDTHTHLCDRAFDKFRDRLMTQIAASDVKICVEVGWDFASSQAGAALAEKYPGMVYAAVGCHPHDAKDFNEKQLERLAELIKTHPGVVALGEIGLDFYRDNSPKDVQRYWFSAQLAVAKELGCPIVIHSRDADQECFDTLKASGVMGKNRVQIHCYSGSAEMAKEYVKLGASISLGGALTFKNARRPVEVARSIPLENLMLETDCPYMAPVPYRGKINNPTYIIYVAERIAEIRGVDTEEIAEVTFQNALDFFSIDYECGT